MEAETERFPKGDKGKPSTHVAWNKLLCTGLQTAPFLETVVTSSSCCHLCPTNALTLPGKGQQEGDEVGRSKKWTENILKYYFLTSYTNTRQSRVQDRVLPERERTLHNDKKGPFIKDKWQFKYVHLITELQNTWRKNLTELKGTRDKSTDSVWVCILHSVMMMGDSTVGKILVSGNS